MTKYIIGLGCSWTQGEGGYPEQVWKDHGGRVQVRGRDDYYLRAIEHENSWVNVLCRDHFTDHIPINLGARGIGNRGAVHQLHFCDKVDFNNSTGIIVLMMSGFERFDFFAQRLRRTSMAGQALAPDDFYSTGEYTHYKWRTMWPSVGHGGGEQELWKIYATQLWSEQFVASEQMMALLDLQTFAKAYGYKVVVANAFNQHDRSQKSNDYLKEHAGYLADKFDWENSYLHNTTSYTAFMQKLVELDGLMKPDEWGGYYSFYSKRDWPAKYLTNCEGAHPTIEGYKVIGKELADFIKLRNYA